MIFTFLTIKIFRFAAVGIRWQQRIRMLRVLNRFNAWTGQMNRAPAPLAVALFSFQGTVSRYVDDDIRVRLHCCIRFQPLQVVKRFSRVTEMVGTAFMRFLIQGSRDNADIGRLLKVTYQNHRPRGILIRHHFRQQKDNV